MEPPPESPGVHGVSQSQGTGQEQGENAAAHRPFGFGSLCSPSEFAERSYLPAGGLKSAIAGAFNEGVPGNGPKGPSGKEQPVGHQSTWARSPPPRASAGGHASGFSSPSAVPQVVVSRKSVYDAGYLAFDTGKPPNECTMDVAVHLDPIVLPHISSACNPEHTQQEVHMMGVKFAKDTNDSRPIGEKTSYWVSYGALLDKAQDMYNVAWDSPLGVALACAVKHDLAWDGRTCKITLTNVDMGRWRPFNQVPGSTGATHTARPAQPQTDPQSHAAAQDHGQDDIHTAAEVMLFLGDQVKGAKGSLGDKERGARIQGGSQNSKRGAGAGSDSWQFRTSGANGSSKHGTDTTGVSGERGGSEAFKAEGDAEGHHSMEEDAEGGEEGGRTRTTSGGRSRPQVEKGHANAREEEMQGAGDAWHRWAAELDPNEGKQVKVTKDVLRTANLPEPYGEEITVPMKVFLCGRPRSLWDGTKEFKQIRVTLPKKGTTDYYSVKMAQLIKEHLAEEWDSLMLQHRQGDSIIARLMKAMMSWKVEALPGLPKGGVAWDPALRCFPVRLVPQTNPHWQRQKKGIPGSEKKKPGRKKRSYSFGTDDEQIPKKSKHTAERRASAPGVFTNGSQEGEEKAKNKGGRPRKEVPVANAAAGDGAGASPAAGGVTTAAAGGASTRGRPRKPTDKLREHMQEGSSSESDSSSSSSSSSQDDEGVQGGGTSAGGRAPGGNAGTAHTPLLPRSTAVGRNSVAADIGPGTQQQKQQEQRQQQRMPGQRQKLKYKLGQPFLSFVGEAKAGAGMNATEALASTPKPGVRASGSTESAPAAAAAAEAAAAAASTAAGRGKTSGLGLSNWDSTFKGTPVHPVQASGSIRGASGSRGGGVGGVEPLHGTHNGSSQAPNKLQGNAPPGENKPDMDEEQRFKIALEIQTKRHSEMKKTADKAKQLALELNKLEESLRRFQNCGLSQEDKDRLGLYLHLPSLAKLNEDLQERHRAASEARVSWEKAKSDENIAYKNYNEMQARISSWDASL